MSVSGFRGYDPYDGLNSRILEIMARHSLLTARILTQVVKRTPVHVQPLIGAHPCVSPTTLGYAMLAISRLRLTSTGSRRWTPVATWLSSETRRLAIVPAENELAWGSHVDVATRFGYVPASTPNVVVSHCAAAGLAAMTVSGFTDERESLAAVGRFIQKRLGRRTPEGHLWYAYTPNGQALVHNGSMLAASTLLRCGSVLDDHHMISDALQAVCTTANYQANDGSWPYAEEREAQWVDSFHTGFILAAMLEASRYDATGRVREALCAGGVYYAQKFFGPCGEPWYYSNSRYPLDAMSAAQGLEVLPALASFVPEALVALEHLIDWCRAHLIGHGGRVAYQVHPHWKDTRQFPRWSLAPMAAALAGLATARLTLRKDSGALAS